MKKINTDLNTTAMRDQVIELTRAQWTSEDICGFPYLSGRGRDPLTTPAGNRADPRPGSVRISREKCPVVVGQGDI